MIVSSKIDTMKEGLVYRDVFQLSDGQTVEVELLLIDESRWFHRPGADSSDWTVRRFPGTTLLLVERVVG